MNDFGDRFTKNFHDFQQLFFSHAPCGISLGWSAASVIPKFIKDDAELIGVRQRKLLATDANRTVGRHTADDMHGDTVPLNNVFDANFFTGFGLSKLWRVSQFLKQSPPLLGLHAVIRR